MTSTIPVTTVTTTHTSQKTTTTPLNTTMTTPLKTTTTTTTPPKTTTTTTTTAKPTTTETKPPITKSATSTTTEEVKTPGPVTGEASEAKAPLSVIVAVPIVVIVILISAIVLIVVFRYRRANKSGIPHERFHDDIVDNTNDGSIAMSNQLFDMNIEDPDGTLQFNQNGDALFSKVEPPVVSNDGLTAFTNPLYETTKNNGTVDQPAVIDSLAEKTEITIPDHSSKTSST